MKLSASLPFRSVLVCPTVPASVALARRTAEMIYVDSWRINPRHQAFGPALLMLSELVTNTVRHAAAVSPQVTVTYAAGPETLAFGVHDRHPHQPDPARFADGPGGLRLIAELTAELCGSCTVLRDVDGGGKTIWISLPI
ncbi:ATP-binding protein [Streptomyces roseifaciens]|uniref:ATP-binding protein n=1 Tax=Streptomyces roseifaciens TaxID=1488406 RepID=UPI0007180447|nr:ATP-binding protein [Streptomyces roseifaciens]